VGAKTWSPWIGQCKFSCPPSPPGAGDPPCFFLQTCTCALLHATSRSGDFGTSVTVHQYRYDKFLKSFDLHIANFYSNPLTKVRERHERAKLSILWERTRELDIYIFFEKCYVEIFANHFQSFPRADAKRNARGFETRVTSTESTLMLRRHNQTRLEIPSPHHSCRPCNLELIIQYRRNICRTVPLSPHLSSFRRRLPNFYLFLRLSITSSLNFERSIRSKRQCV